MKNFKDKKLVVLGDSIMFGSGNDGFGIGEYLEKEFGFEFYKYAVGGARVGFVNGKSWVVEQVRKLISDGVQPDYIVFDGFTNDCHTEDGEALPDVPFGTISDGYTGFDVFAVSKENTEFCKCFEEVVYALLTRFPKAKILFVRPHNMGRRDDKLQKDYGEAAIKICEKWSVPYVDLYKESGMNTFLPEHRDLFTCDSYGWGRGDCTHPNALGYELKYMPLIASKLKTL